MTTALGDVAIMGGGCYGTFYLGQLHTARARGAITFRQLLIVDQDPHCPASAAPTGHQHSVVVSSWDAFLDHWLDAAARDHDGLPDMIVPTPLMPHLMAHWLERTAKRRWPDRDVALIPPMEPLGTPYDRLHTDDVRYVSFADWLCPTHCVEPLLCPAIKAPRTWEMGDAIAAWNAKLEATGTLAPPVLFTCRHVAFGVGMFPVSAAIDGVATFTAAAERAATIDLAIGSISACHGALAMLRVAVRNPIPHLLMTGDD